jgi:hypothetical protein
MIAVAALAVALGIVTGLERRRERFMRIADHHEERKLEFVFGLHPPSKQLRIWNEQMRQKYHRAARSPWLPVEPDPPEPK